MSFWSFWSRKSPGPTPLPVEPERRPSFTVADRDYVRNALDRFEASGLRIQSDLDRELIAVRALIDIERWKPDHRASGDDDLVSLFLALACETDSLTWYVEDVQEAYPRLSSLDDDTAEQRLQEHSFSIFVNAGSITTVNEDNSLENMVYDLAELGNLDVSQTSLNPMKSGLTRVTFQVEGLGEFHFDIDSSKRPDITPALDEMNRIVRSKNLGRYIVVHEGNSESETFIFATEALIPGITGLLKLQAG
jgi:hypothetical protein